MSNQKNQLTKFGGVEIVTGINTVGIIYLYYELSKLGTDLNRKIISVIDILKKLNKNVNVIDMHLKKHLLEEKINNENEESSNEMLKELLTRVDNIEKRIEILEDIQVNNKKPLKRNLTENIEDEYSKNETLRKLLLKVEKLEKKINKLEEEKN